MENKEYWKSKVWGIETLNFFDLIKQLNEFYKDKFIIATQVFYNNGKWRAIVYYKEK